MVVMSGNGIRRTATGVPTIPEASMGGPYGRRAASDGGPRNVEERTDAGRRTAPTDR